MFSRLASTAARASLRRAAAARGLSTAAVRSSSTGSVAGGAAVVALAGAFVAAYGQVNQEALVLCAAPFPYTGQPGTDRERSFIVSRGSV